MSQHPPSRILASSMALHSLRRGLKSLRQSLNPFNRVRSKRCVRPTPPLAGDAPRQDLVQTSTSPIPCIYLLRLGSVQECRAHIREADNLCRFKSTDTVFKFGLTDDLCRRLREHRTKTFARWNVPSVDLVLFTVVPVELLYPSERILSDAFSLVDMRLKHSRYKELAILPASKLPMIKRIMGSIGEKHGVYVKRTAEYIRMLEERLHNVSNNVVEHEPRDEVAGVLARDVNEHDGAHGVETQHLGPFGRAHAEEEQREK